MGYMVGMPCLKLNNVGRKTASCGSFGAVAAEALEERQGRDPDIDRERSSENIYTGFRTAAELQEYSREHVAELSADLQAQGKRKIREDAVVMCVTIIKPPAAFMATLSEEEQIRFLQDADEKLNELIGGEQNSKSTVIHRDEQGSHLHKFWEPMTEDGRLCAKEMMNIQFFGRLNREMPAFLRSRGWDIDDCHAYDEAKEQLKSEQEKYQERRERGRSSVVYKAQAEAEKNRLSEKVDELQAEVSRLEGDLRQAKLEVAEARQQAKSAVDEADRAEQRTAEAEQRLSELIEPIHSLEEYHLTADKAEDVVTAIEASENAIEGLQRLPRLVPFYNRQKASKDVLEVSNGLRKLFDIAKDLVRRLFGFEELSRMPEKKRRSPRLDERIKQAEAIASNQQDKGGRSEISLE